jgi:hypothetical protein
LPSLAIGTKEYVAHARNLLSVCKFRSQCSIAGRLKRVEEIGFDP